MERIRFAVVGQGYFAQSAILPAFANTENCTLTALFSDDPNKLQELKRKYRVEHALPYSEYDQARNDRHAAPASVSLARRMQ
jgi:glucose-fructose oxidoreductase